MKIYNKEFAFVLIAFSYLSFTFSSMYINFSVIFMTEDRNDEAQIQISRRFAFYYAIMEFVGKMILSMAKCLKKRRPLYLLGMYFNVVGWTLFWLARMTGVSFTFHSILTFLELCVCEDRCWCNFLFNWMCILPSQFNCGC